MTADFSIRYIIDRDTNSLTIQLTDASTGVTNLKGNFKVTFPDGSVYENKSFTSPNISAPLGVASIPAKIGSDGEVRRGAYTFIYTALDTDTDELDGVTKTFTFTFDEPEAEITNASDVTIPKVAFSCDTVFTQTGWTETPSLFNLACQFPSTSSASATTLDEDLNGTRELDMVLTANYYEGLYQPVVTYSGIFQNDTLAYLSVQFIENLTQDFTIRKCLPAATLLTAIDNFKDTESGDKVPYNRIVSLYSNIYQNIYNGYVDAGNDLLTALYEELGITLSGAFQAGAISCDIYVAADAITLTAAIQSGDGQTVWQEDQFAPVVFTINAGDADFTVSGVPAGATFDKPSRTLSGVTYASLSSGVNTITITFDGTGGYTGSVEVDVTVTKTTVWNFYTADLGAGVTLEESFDFTTEDGDFVTHVDNKISEVVGRIANSATQTIEASKPYINFESVRGCAAQQNNNSVGHYLDAITDNSLGTSYSIFFLGVIGFGASNQGDILFKPSNSDRIYIDGRFPRFSVTLGGVGTLITISQEYTPDICGVQGLWEFRINPSETKIFLNTELIGTGAAVGEFDTSLPFLLFGRDGAGRTSHGGFCNEFSFLKGAPSASVQEKIEGNLMWKGGIQDKIPSGHAFENQRPLA
jgi:hypothetical protein